MARYSSRSSRNGRRRAPCHCPVDWNSSRGYSSAPMTLACRALLLASVPCACTLAPPPQHLPRWSTAPQEPASGPGQWGERVLFEANAAPVAQLTRDFDGLPDNSRSEDATGWGVRAGIGDQERSGS